MDDCWNRIGVSGDSSCPELEKHVHCRNCPIYSAAALELLDCGLPANYVEDATDHFAVGRQIEEVGSESMVIFRVGAEWLALQTSVFEEVADLRAIHSLPHRREGVVLGLANVRGELLVCVSLSRALGLQTASDSKSEKIRTALPRLLVIRRKASRAAFPVDEVYGVHRFHPLELKALPATVAHSTSYTSAVAAWKDKSVGILDVQLVLYMLDRSLA